MKRALSATGKGWYLAILVLLGISLAACGGGGDGGGNGGGNPTVPAVPSNLKATVVSSSRIDLVWVDASGNEDGFRVYRGPTSAAVATLVATLGAGSTSYSDNGLSVKTVYHYKVTAFNSVGESAASNVDNATTLNDVPAPPASLKATAVSNSAIDLVWVDASGNEDGFRVYRGLDINTVTDNIATLGAGSTSYSDNGLAASTNYYYKVTAFNILGESLSSNVDNATTGPVTIPSAPTNLVAALASGSSVGLTWIDASGNEDGFRVYRGTGPSPASFALIASLAANTAAYADVTAFGTTTYIYRVTAFNAGGESPPAQSNPVTTPTVVASVDGGNRHSLAVKSDGTVWAWGSNDNGALGVGSAVTRSLVPVVVPGVGGATAISAGDEHSLALLSNGTIVAWGQNFYGGVGSGDNVTPQYNPVRVKGPGGVGVFDNVSAVSAGGYYSVALRNDGTAWTWGSGFYGQLGNGTVQIPSFTPAQVPGLTRVMAISASQNHTLALRNDGTVWAWGSNSDGQIGNGAFSDNQSTPVQVHGFNNVGFLDNVQAISAGETHSLALKGDGTVWAWGSNSLGELGDNTVTRRTSPVHVHGFNNVGFLDTVQAISAGGFFSVALKSDGTVWAWGSRQRGQIGDGPPVTGATITPVPVHDFNNVGFLDNVQVISASKDHTLSKRNGESVWAWGSNEFGQIGDNTTINRLTPVPVAGF